MSTYENMPSAEYTPVKKSVTSCCRVSVILKVSVNLDRGSPSNHENFVTFGYPEDMPFVGASGSGYMDVSNAPLGSTIFRVVF